MLKLQDIPTSLAWTFTHLLPGTFKRNRPEFAHHDYPIVAPLPAKKNQTQPLQGASEAGPFIYFVTDAGGKLCYVGKSKEENVLRRWIRPGNGGPTTHYWTHSTASGGCVFEIAKGIKAGKGPFSLRFTTLHVLRKQFADVLGLTSFVDEKSALEHAEKRLIALLQPAWNR